MGFQQDPRVNRRSRPWRGFGMPWRISLMTPVRRRKERRNPPSWVFGGDDWGMPAFHMTENLWKRPTLDQIKPGLFQMVTEEACPLLNCAMVNWKLAGVRGDAGWCARAQGPCKSGPVEPDCAWALWPALGRACGETSRIERKTAGEWCVCRGETKQIFGGWACNWGW